MGGGIPEPIAALKFRKRRAEKRRGQHHAFQSDEFKASSSVITDPSEYSNSIASMAAPSAGKIATDLTRLQVPEIHDGDGRYSRVNY